MTLELRTTGEAVFAVVAVTTYMAAFMSLSVVLPTLSSWEAVGPGLARLFAMSCGAYMVLYLEPFMSYSLEVFRAR